MLTTDTINRFNNVELYLSIFWESGSDESEAQLFRAYHENDNHRPLASFRTLITVDI